MPRLLSKSRFQLAQECPTKLFFTGKAEFPSTKADDPFLQALAEGGFQVGAFAKAHFPGGVEIATLDPDAALAETERHLRSENVTLFEPAFRFNDLFVRIDVLVKKGSEIGLHEVKAKSFFPSTDSFFKVKREKGLLAEWEPYLADIAFQTFVARRARPDLAFFPSLMLVNKEAVAPVDGLNQLFRLYRTKGKPRVEVTGSVPPAAIAAQLLLSRRVDEEVSFLLESRYEGKTFAEWAEHLAGHYARDEKLPGRPGKQCKSCEYRTPEDEPRAPGHRDGFSECWSEALGRKPEGALIIDLWNYRKADERLAEGKIRLSEMEEIDVGPEPREDGPGLSYKERQWLQVRKEKEGDPTPYLDTEGLAREMARWKFPLHFIDFETTGLALPFHRGRRPYEQIAFQFSHHTIDRDGHVAHAGEYLNRRRGEFPNFDFVRALKRELEGDEGTIFRYAAHENTILCLIHDQLLASEIPSSEKDELTGWIRTITRKPGKDGERRWEGPRALVDMRELVLRYAYHPETGGSNSIKAVLPATLNASAFLQQKYARPIYGAKDGIPSRNFRDQAWVSFDRQGRVRDPYRTLEPIFSPAEDEIVNRLCPETEIADGGAAMMAYARMQFTEMSGAEAERICKALLRYCELDTLAMVFLYEAWREDVAL